MEPSTAMARGIRATEGRSAYDNACKRLLSQKIILAWIMKSCLEEYRELEVQEIAERYIEGKPLVSQEPVFPGEGGPLIRGTSTEDSSLSEGTVTYDICFRATAPASGEIIELYINVEAQGKFNPGYPLLKRGIYYCSRMISSQSGRDFTDSHYEKIKKVYSIWVCLNSPENRKNTVVSYQLVEKSLIGKVKEPPANYDLLSVVMICLGGPEADRYEGILKLLHTLLSNETSAKEKQEVLESEFDIPMTHELESEVSTMCNLSQSVEEKGIEKGIEKGVERNTVHTLEKLMKNLKMPIEQALATLEIPEADWQKYRKLLAGQ